MNDYAPPPELGSLGSELFWEILSQVKGNPNKLRSFFSDKSIEEITGFHNTSHDIAGHCSMDYFMPPQELTYPYTTDNTQFKYDGTENRIQESGWYALTQGKEFLENLWDNPEMFWNLLSVEFYPYPSFWGVLTSVCQERFGGLPEHLDWY